MTDQGVGGPGRKGGGSRWSRAFLQPMGVVALAGLLSGCSWIFGGPKTVPCPESAIEPELQTIAQFAPGAAATQANVQSGGKVTKVSAACKGDDNGIRVKLTIDFEAARLDRSVQQARYPYLVALTDRDHNILQEQTFGLGTDFSNGDRIGREDSVTITIPTSDPKSGGDYVVFVGFKLTPDQLAFNRTVGTP